jgi:hypothetical protein
MDQSIGTFILTGQTGTGKTWLTCAFGHQAARLHHSVLYVRMPRLFEDMAMARLDGRFPKLVDKLARVQLLILDGWGTHGLTDQQRLNLLELLEERYQRRSTIITAQLPVSGWHDVIGEPTIAPSRQIFIENRLPGNGCHPRPVCPQRPPHRPQGRQYATKRSKRELDPQRKYRNTPKRNMIIGR